MPAEAGIQCLKSLDPSQKHAGMTRKWDSAVTRLLTDEMQPVIGKIHDQIKTIEHISTNNRIDTVR